MEDAEAIGKSVKIYLGTSDTKEDLGDQYSASAIYIHPERMKLEIEHREMSSEADPNLFEPFAGPYDLTLVKLDREVKFQEGKVYIRTNIQSF